MEDGGWRVEGGGWRTKDGGRRTKDGGWRVAHRVNEDSLGLTVSDGRLRDFRARKGNKATVAMKQGWVWQLSMCQNDGAAPGVSHLSSLLRLVSGERQVGFLTLSFSCLTQMTLQEV